MHMLYRIGVRTQRGDTPACVSLGENSSHSAVTQVTIG
jgi:hypothetical protein